MKAWLSAAGAGTDTLVDSIGHQAVSQQSHGRIVTLYIYIYILMPPHALNTE